MFNRLFKYNFYRDTVIVNEEEALRSSTYNSQEPKIMILRRPQATVEEIPNGNISKQKNPVKTLEQVPFVYLIL